MIDLKAAYDHIDRHMIFRALEIRTKSTKIITILKSLYTGTIAEIKHTDELFNVHMGCRQGGLESPVLFNIYMDFVIRCAEFDVLKKFPNTGVNSINRIKSESTIENSAVFIKFPALNGCVCYFMLMTLCYFVRILLSSNRYSRYMMKLSEDMDLLWTCVLEAASSTLFNLVSYQ